MTWFQPIAIIQRDGKPFHWPVHEEIPEIAAGG
jgi:hypothetical protein